jgi:RNA polymerase sigma-70 factor (ECF subfamily)
MLASIHEDRESEPPYTHPVVQGPVRIDSDADILRAAATGATPAVRACIERFAPLVVLLARKTLADKALIEDAVQDVFVEIWRNAHKYDPSIASARAFVAMIARRRLIDRGRYEQARIRGVAPLAAAQDRPTREDHSRSTQLAEDAQRARALIEALPQPQRQVVALALANGWSHQRIADHLGMPLGTVKTVLRRNIFALRSALGETPGDNGRAQGGAP